MDEPTLDPEYFEQLKPVFLKLFRKFVKPANVIHLLQESEMLTETDLSEIKATTNTKGEIEGSVLLFERLTLYEGWYPRLLEVLRDRDVKLSHVAREMEDIKGLLDTDIQEEQIWHVGIPLFTSGMTSIQHHYAHSSMLLKLSDDLILLVYRKKLLKMKVKLEQVQLELNEIKRRQRIERDTSELASDSAATKQEHYVLGSDYEELLKKQEELQIKLARLEEEYSDYKLSCKKLEEEKDEQIKEATENLQKQNQDFTMELENTRKKLDDSLSYINQICKEKEELELELNMTTERLHKENDAVTVELKETTQKFQTQKKDFTVELENARKKLDESLSDSVKIREEKQELQNTLAQLEEEYSDYKLSCAKLDKVKDEQLKETTENLQKQNHEMVIELQKTIKTLTETGKEKEKKETEIRHLEEQVKYFQDKMHLEMKYTLVMVGKVGNGKSESGNTLLGRRVFHDYPGCDPGTLNVCKGKAKIQQELFEVFDTPGIVSYDMSLNEMTVSAVQNATEIMNRSKRGVTAFLFFFTLGSRYTPEDARAIKILMDIYGSNAIHKFGICLLTFGEYGYYDKKLTINEWYEKQNGALKDYLCRFNKRIVLMLNKGNQIERERCRAEVFDIVRQLSQQQDPYTKEDFKKQAAFHKEQKLRLKILKFYREVPNITRENQLQLLARADKLINKKTPLNPGIDDEETITLQKVRTILQDIIKKPSYNKSQFTQLLHLLPS